MAREQKKDLSERVKARVAEFAVELREMMYGTPGCPEWGTLFSVIEGEGLAIGQELSRQYMQQSVGEQARQTPEGCLQCGDETALDTGQGERVLETQAGPIAWQEPQGYLKESRRAFFPSGEGSGPGGG